MDFASVLRVALRTLARNKMRAALTMLGIMIGSSAVICTVAIGEGGSERIEDQLMMLGENFVWIEAGGRNIAGRRTGSGETKTLVLDDLQAIKTIPFVKQCSPQVDERVQVVHGNQNWNTRYRGVSAEYLEIRKWSIASGGPFTPQEVDTAANVVLLGQTATQYLFAPNEDPIGKTIRIGTYPFTVIGTLHSKGMSATGWDQDDFMLMPYTTAMRKVKGNNWLDDIVCSAVSAEAVIPAQYQITQLLRERHHIFPGQMDDFNIRSPGEILQARADASKTLTLMLAAVASISLLVGGIGVMNIMLVSVTERTHEIGVRMAVGATERDVQLQFLTEAVVLSLMGGAAGILTGLFASQALAELLSWPISLSIETIVVAVLFSIATGIFFGYYPAQKAARLDPIEALRYE